MIATRVYKYGVRSIVEHQEVALDEMGRSHGYYNALMGVRIEQRKKLDALHREHVPELGVEFDAIDAISSDIDSIFEELRDRRRKASAPKNEGRAKPTRLQLTEEQEMRLSALKSERSRRWESIKRLRKQFTNLVEGGRREFDERTSDAPKQLLMEIRSVGEQLREARKIRKNPDVAGLRRRLTSLKNEKKKHTPATHKKRALNEKVWEQMLNEPGNEAWKQERAIELWWRGERERLRSESRLTHGTYSAVEAAVDQAWSKGRQLTYQRWEGGRKVGRQLLAGLAAKDFYAGADPSFAIVSRGAPQGKRVDPMPRRESSARNFSEYAIVSMALGKGADRKAITMEVYLHRPIPLDATITWAYLVPKRSGFRTTYTLQLTMNVEREGHVAETNDPCEVRLRWSANQMEQKWCCPITVAEINGEPFALDGHEYQARSPHYLKRGGAYGALAQARSLRGFADEQFEVARRELVTWVESASVPEWLARMASARAATETERGQCAIGQSRSHARIATIASTWIRSTVGIDAAKALFREWRAHRDSEQRDYFEPKPAALARWLASKGVVEPEHHMAIWLEWWRVKDAHLMQWAADQDRKGRNNRRDQYRVKAAQLARRYSTCTVFDARLSESAKRKEIGGKQEKRELLQDARRNRTVAAPSEFALALKHAFGPGRFFERSIGEKSSGGARNGRKNAGTSDPLVYTETSDQHAAE